MFFDELSNDEWALLAALVSDEPAVRLNRRGRPRAEPRIVANAVLWILTTANPGRSCRAAIRRVLHAGAVLKNGS
jgi:hypothetical protein